VQRGHRTEQSFNSRIVSPGIRRQRRVQLKDLLKVSLGLLASRYVPALERLGMTRAGLRKSTWTQRSLAGETPTVRNADSVVRTAP
jgi:hypothetical protein